MKTPVVVFKRIEFLENSFIVECLTELNKTTPLVFASDDEEFSQSEAFKANDFEGATSVLIATNTPIDLQKVRQELSGDLVYLLVDLEAAAAVISYRIPTVWFQLEGREVPSLQATEVINRAYCTLSSEEFRRRFDIDTQYFREIGSISVRDVNDLIFAAKTRIPDQSFHRLLVAEIFHRHHLLEKEFLSLRSEITSYLHSEILSRLSSLDTENFSFQPIETAVDPKGELISSFLQNEPTPVDSEINYVPQGLLKYASEVNSSGSIKDLLKIYETAISAEASETSFRIIFQALAAQINSESSLKEVLKEVPEVFSEVPLAEFADSLKLNDVVEMSKIPDLPKEVLREFASNDSYFISLVGLMALSKRKSEENLSADVMNQVKAGIKEIDQHALYINLWLTGLRYWNIICDDGWDPDSVGFKEPVVIQIKEKYSPHQVAAIERNARRLLSVGLYNRSAQKFEIVRSASTTNRQFSTELAARLNIGWAHWAQGKPRQVWEPYISSVLQEAGPAQDLVCLRLELESFLKVSNASQQEGGLTESFYFPIVKKWKNHLIFFIRSKPLLAVPFFIFKKIIRVGLRVLKRVYKKTVYRFYVLFKKSFSGFFLKVNT